LFAYSSMAPMAVLRCASVSLGLSFAASSARVTSPYFCASTLHSVADISRASSLPVEVAVGAALGVGAVSVGSGAAVLSGGLSTVGSAVGV
jgi:hypothetical protein